MALVVNMSGGKDSCAMLAYLCERYPGIQKYVIHADTGFEHIRPVSAAAFSESFAAGFGLPLHVCRNPNKTYLEMVARRGMFPGPATRQCTSDLKRGPIETWIRRNVRARVIVNCLGLRAEESPGRARQRALSRNRSLSKAGRVVWNWLPIHQWTAEQVYGFLADRELPLHPVYRRAGGYLDRLSCRVCIFMGDAELRAVHAHDREAFDLVANLERSTGFTMKPGRSLPMAVLDHPSVAHAG